MKERVEQYYFTIGSEGNEFEFAESLLGVGAPVDRKDRIEDAGLSLPPVPEDLADPEISDNGLWVMQTRYLARDEAGRVAETPKELFWRVAWNIAQAEDIYSGDPENVARQFYDLMSNLDFLPNSPTLMNAGRELQQLSGCFVLPVDDSVESIMKASSDAAVIYQAGGGVGFSFSGLRPEGSLIRSSGGTSSGPVSFMEIPDAVTGVIKQGGRGRGANMGVMSVHHPDIGRFIDAKKETGKLTNFNLSVALSDGFMEAVVEDTDYQQINPHTGERKSVRAREIFDQIVEAAWENGEPGVVFLDCINETNPTRHIGEIEAVNVCGEQPLHPYESCNLGSINLAQMVDNGKVDWDKLRRTVGLATRFLDDVIDMNLYPLPEIEEITLGNRRIGLGIMGLADMLVQLGLPYGNERGREKAGEVMKFIRDAGYEASRVLAEERGVFPNWEGSQHQTNGDKLRNATVTTVAPTGTLAILAEASHGSEPPFALCYKRFGNWEGGGQMEHEINPYFLKAAKEAGLSRELIEAVKERGTTQGIDGVPDELREIYATANEIGWEDHVVPTP